MNGWNEIGRLIKMDRIKKNLNQGPYGELFGVTQQTITQWEKGNKIKDTYWEKISSETGINIGDIVSYGIKNYSNKAENVSQGSGTIHATNGQRNLPPALNHLVDLLLQHDKDSTITNELVMSTLQRVANGNDSQ